MDTFSIPPSSSPSILPSYTPQNPFRLDAVENPWSPLGWKSIKSVTSVICGPEITDEILRECVDLFNQNFGVWGELAQQYNWRAKPGSAVRTNVKGLRRQCISCEAATTLVRHHVQDKFVGYAFATRWPYHRLKGNVCWITQVVVDQSYRGVGIATCLLEKLRVDTDVLFGIISSHPAALMALVRAAAGEHPVGSLYDLSVSISALDITFTQKHASRVLRRSTIDYLQNTGLQGSLFRKRFKEDKESLEDESIVSCIETEFMMAHDDALWALSYLESLEGFYWPLGDLHDGYEFIVLVMNKDYVVRSW